MDHPRIARAWITLMDRIGYERWGAQGGDLGCAVTDEIAKLKPADLIGTHLNFAMFRPTPDEVQNATPEERAALSDAKNFWDNLSGYAKEQSTRPQTIGYSLADSPVGQAAWIYAMFQDTCGTPGDAEASFALDEMLDDIMMYWLPNSGASSARLYWEMTQNGWIARNHRRPDHCPGRVHHASQRSRQEITPAARAPLLQRRLLQRARRGRSLLRPRTAGDSYPRHPGNLRPADLTGLSP